MRLFNRVRSCTSDCSWPTAAVGMPTRSELEAPSNHEARRVLLVGWVMIGLVSVAMIGLLLRVVQLQTMPLQAIDQLVDSQSSRRTLKARRGSLLDRVGRPASFIDFRPVFISHFFHLTLYIYSGNNIP